jgi:hypothetical protein
MKSCKVEKNQLCTISCEVGKKWKEGREDFRYEDGRLLVCESCVTISNPGWLSSSEAGVRWKKT